jgi:hypothetical protein
MGLLQIKMIGSSMKIEEMLALSLALTKIRPRIEELACQKQA